MKTLTVKTHYYLLKPHEIQTETSNYYYVKIVNELMPERAVWMQGYINHFGGMSTVGVPFEDEELLKQLETELEEALSEKTEVSEYLEDTQNKLEWIEKRVPLDDMQREYVGFILNEQVKMTKLFSAHIFAARAHTHLADLPKLGERLDRAIADIGLSEGFNAEDEREDCKHYDEAQGKNYCLNPRCTWVGEKKSCKGVCIYFEK